MVINTINFANFEQIARKISMSDQKDFIAVTLGAGSYIVNASLEYGSSKCHVLIGRYSSIAHRVKFIVFCPMYCLRRLFGRRYSKNLPIKRKS